MTADRMAGQRDGADQILAGHPPGPHPVRSAGRSRPAALANERDYQELKQELGLAHYEGRGWRGFHHQAGRGGGRPRSRTRRDPEHQPVQVKALALGLPEAAWQTITWREGSADWLSSRYARLRVRAAHRDDRLKERRAEEWLLIEWPDSETEPTKYWLATLPDHIPFDRLVDLA